MPGLLNIGFSIFTYSNLLLSLFSTLLLQSCMVAFDSELMMWLCQRDSPLLLDSDEKEEPCPECTPSSERVEDEKIKDRYRFSIDLFDLFYSLSLLTWFFLNKEQYWTELYFERWTRDQRPTSIRVRSTCLVTEPPAHCIHQRAGYAPTRQCLHESWLAWNENIYELISNLNRNCFVFIGSLTRNTFSSVPS